MNKNIYFTIIFIAFLVGCQTTSEPAGIDFSRWKGPRCIFDGDASHLFLQKSMKHQENSFKKAKVFSKNDTYYFIIEEGQSNFVLLYNDRENCVRIEVPKYAHRPLSAQWINDKLLYLTVWFNPHFGAYAVYDVEKESIVYSELMNDGTQAWYQYEESKNANKKAN